MKFLRNVWYMAAWARECAGKSVSRIILNEPVVLFRAADGSVSALKDVCPHRAVPLSLGSIHGDHIRCAYHGLEFDGSGICRRNPHIKGAPDRIQAQAYPVVEKHGMIWIWMGDPALAEPTKVVDYSWFSDPEKFATVTGYIKIDADYRLVIDNLMDLAHAEYIHPDTVGSPGSTEVQQVEIVSKEDAISVNTLWPDLPPNAVNKAIWTRTERIDEYLDMTWRPASNLVLDLGIMAPGEPRSSGYHTPSAHILTPETERSTHYFWAFARDFDKDNKHLDEHLTRTIGEAFTNEDKPIVEAAQRMIEMTQAKLANFTMGDSGSNLVRRALERFIKSEADALNSRL